MCFFQLGGQPASEKIGSGEESEEDDSEGEEGVQLVDNQNLEGTIVQAKMLETGSLHELIDELFAPERPVRYRSTFFMHHRGFVETPVLLGMLHKRYSGDKPSSASEVTVADIANKMAVMTVVIEWANSRLFLCCR